MRNIRKRRAQKNLVSAFLDLEKYRPELVIDLSHLVMFRRQAPTELGQVPSV